MRRSIQGALLPALFLAPLTLISCESPADGMAGDVPIDARPMEQAPSQEPVAAMDGAEEAFFVTLPAGERLVVGVFPNPDGAGKKLVFGEPVAKTDRNIFPIARTSMWEIYGRQRGHFTQKDMTIAVREDLGSVVVFRTSTGSRLGVYPMLDAQGAIMEGMLLWME